MPSTKLSMHLSSYVVTAVSTAAFTALKSPVIIAIYLPGHTVCASTISTSDVFTIASAAVTPVDVVLNSIIPIALLILCTSFLISCNYNMAVCYFCNFSADRCMDSDT